MCAEARGEKAETACTNEACRLDGGRGSMALCRVKRNILVFIVMCCSVLWIAMLTVGFSCCAVVQQAVITSSEGQVQRLDELVAQDRATYRHIAKENAMSKKLLQDTSSWTQVQNSRLSPAGIQHSPDHRAALSDQQTVYDYEELSDSNSEQDENRNHFSENTNHDRTSPGPIQRVGAAGTKKLPQAIIIGVKKGGTRALLEFLRIHPDVRAPGPETHFFDRYYHKGLQWYRLEMPPTMEGQMTIEKTPSYFITKEVPRRIFSMSPNIKLIVVVRDPVTRAISDYTQAASKRPGMKPFEHMAFLDNYTGLVNTSWGAIRIGVYAKHLDKWLKYFPLSQMHFVSGEKLITDPAGQMARVQDFLGLKRVISEKHFYFNETKGFPCLKKTEGSGRPHCLGKSKGRQHPKVGPRLLQRLRDFFRPFNAKFYQMVGQDFGWP